MPIAKRFFDSILDWLAPRDCAACGCETRCGLCADCRQKLDQPPRCEVEGVPVFASTSYRSPIDRAIQRFKYESRPDLAGALAALVPRPPIELERAIVVPVPLHPTRLVERGYNQSALLARRLARRFELELEPLGLRRLVATEHQARLGPRDRAANVLGAFDTRSAGALSGKPILLVDDVVTTGATARGCIEALRRSGARPIAVACVAVTGVHLARRNSLLVLGETGMSARENC